jgi:hypothetical protein
VLALFIRPPATRALARAGALVLPAAALLATTMCAETPPARSPAEQPPVASTPDASSASWIVPDVPLARRTILLLRPPSLAPDAASITAIAPDPPPLTEKRQWVYDLRYDKGDVYLAGVHATELPEPRATPRVMGRFALEIYAGPALLERVRFDFPGLGAPPDTAGTAGGARLHGHPVSFTAKLRTRVGVMLPATSRGTKLELWDRATNQRWPLPWPAVEMTTTEDVADAGSSDVSLP